MTSPYSKPPPPIPQDLPAGRFGRWLYEFWDYVARNRLQAADNFVAGTGILVGTSTATFTIAHTTSGVAAGTYGSSGAIPQIVVNNLGHITSVGTATTGGGGTSTLALAGAVTGTGLVPGTLTAAFAPNPSFSGTATSTGLYAFGRVAAAVGSSSQIEGVPVTLLGSAGFVASSAAAFTLMSGNIPANAMLRAGRGFEVRAWGSVGTSISAVGLVYGTGTLISLTMFSRYWEASATVLAQSASAQTFVARIQSFISTGVPDIVWNAGTLALEAGTAAGLFIRGTKGTNTAMVRQDGMLVKHAN